MVRFRRPLILTTVVAIAAFALVAAGCGRGGGSAGVANVATSTTAATTTTTHGGLIAFSRCMRTHGVANFPDPQVVGGRNAKAAISRLAGSNPRFQPAERACHQFLPNGGRGSRETAQQNRTRLADELSFARCMRSHGLTRFPDPTAQAGLTVELVQAQGIDVHSTAFLRVVQACLPASHGALTPARVREALNNAGG
jgi:hypothetical protein